MTSFGGIEGKGRYLTKTKKEGPDENMSPGCERRESSLKAQSGGKGNGGLEICPSLNG